MSQYLNFYVRHDKEFVPIADYSRSTKIYQAIQAPYEQIRLITIQELEVVAEKMRTAKNSVKTQIEDINRKIDFISKTNNSLDEKLDAIESYLKIIEEYKEDIEILDKYAIELEFIADMGYENQIFVGVEIGSPTVNDII